MKLLTAAFGSDRCARLSVVEAQDTGEPSDMLLIEPLRLVHGRWERRRQQMLGKGRG